MNLRSILLLLLSFVVSLKANTWNDIQFKDLLVGDIIFWADTTTHDRAGHVAIVTQVSTDIKKLRIAHSTDNPKYISFVETYLPSSSQIGKLKKHYVVLRLKSHRKRECLNLLIKKWLYLGIPFNAEHEKKMNRWDDAMPTVTSATKVKLQHIMFTDGKKITRPLPPGGFMCSEVVIEALQRVFMSTLPDSLRLDPVLCPPSTMMLSLLQDHHNFLSLGVLTIPKFEFSLSEKEAFKHAIEKEMLEKKQKWREFCKSGG